MGAYLRFFFSFNTIILKLSKKLAAYARLKGCQIVQITYWHNRFKKLGYDVVKEIDGNFHIQLTIKPVHYSNGDRWFTTDYTSNPLHFAYTKNIGHVPDKFPNLQPQWTGSIVSGTPIAIDLVQPNS